VARRKRRRISGCGACLLAVVLPFGLLFVFMAVYLFAPLPIDFLLLGIDRVPEGTALGRSDTIILVSTQPFTARVKMLSIPRDLWVNIPGVGENRINTAHFFAEANLPGSGPQAAAQTVEQNFGVAVPYTVRLRFDAVLHIVDALGGVTLNLPEDMGGLPAGEHHLTGEQALAFVRDRQGADDFFRMEHGQVMLKAITAQTLSPNAWPRLPAVLQAAMSSVDTNLPAWQLPRLGFAFLRAALTGSLDARTISREMTTPYVTDGGAQVLLPNWELINPYVKEMFPR
jgi:LCP family protein required for cell wall assembly